ncbi:polysaccharide biosynthesis protein [Ruminococcus sp. CLA-AA-H200]|uniref:Polysaccharide biosynthesis protein n=1 Tax=Ruminococcus turbiniformis TaxID=2881258 RepID=A0ABS8FYR9_9FIRM|nr:nucleoside-diphosphate sugar epimerase/dehydratase [Ruminococcus turbiniformis]MCC2255205.1 polysaccharide biosynthesis protein [Ruminococcus turbiniformis]
MKEEREEWEKKDYIWIKRAIILLFLDMISILASYLAALLLRFDFVFSSIPREYIAGYCWSMPYWVIVTIVVFYGLRLYHSIWRFAGMDEAKRIVQAYIILVFLYGAGILVMNLHMPKSYYFVGYVFSIILTMGLRFSYRLIRSYLNGKIPGNDSNALDRVMIIGAGQAGQALIKEMQTNSRLHVKVCCVIDDNPNKKGRMLEGVPIVGNRYDIIEKVKEYEINRIVYAIPATTGENRKAILNICKSTGCKMQTVPGTYQILSGEVSVTKLRDVEITDLLGRAQVKVNNSEILHTLKNKVVMVTGGGGSIGSELCRQIARSEPRILIIFDIYENNAYAIQQELKRKYPHLNLVTLIGSVRNTRRVDSVIEKYRPDIIFHAAAHKHVPLMEDSPNEAIKNNVEGTYKVAQSAARWGVKKFVLISTDKAVNPTNIMGASKRLCEMVVQMMNRQSETDFVAVRFGNVLGSNGSVIPLFKKQIAEGGPVTVTDKRIIRYFMTIPEAVSLVLQAAYYAHGGEIFVLDMGEPVKIDDLARNMIRLSGFVPDEDIKIEYTGLRPGEKLYEELLMDEEGMQETENKLIFIGKPIEMDDEDFKQKLQLLDKESRSESGRIKEIVAEIVPTYHPDLEHGLH